jgi:outer membrane protein TolC
MLPLLILGSLSAAAVSHAAQETLSLSRAEAERESLRNSSQLQSFVENRNAAEEATRAQYANLFPRLTFDAYYRYLSFVPSLTAGPTVYQFGAHNNYAYGPTLSYTLWDTYSARKAYYGAEKFTDSRDRSRRDGELQLLLATRSDYVRVQELLEELKAVSDSLDLARAQNQFIVTRLRAGGSTKLDRVESDRAVLSYEIQFEQKQSELSASLRDLLARTKTHTVSDVSRPGPAGVPNVTLVLDFDSLQKSLAQSTGVPLTPPDENHPRIAAQELMAESSDYQAESIKAGLWPTFKLVSSVTPQYPTGPTIAEEVQGSVLITATVPLFEMNQTRHQAEQKSREAASARYEKEQTQTDLVRDYGKSQDYLLSLRLQQKLAAQDVTNSSEAARLYYQSYKAGKSQLIDVQNADNRALLSKVNKARIDAAILNQIDLLRAISGKEAP